MACGPELHAPPPRKRRMSGRRGAARRGELTTTELHACRRRSSAAPGTYRLSTNPSNALMGFPPDGVNVPFAVNFMFLCRLMSRRPSRVSLTLILDVPAAENRIRPDATSTGSALVFLASLPPGGTWYQSITAVPADSARNATV